MKPVKLQRVSNEPIMVSRKDVPWERNAVFNAGVVEADDGKYHLFYRGTCHDRPGVCQAGTYYDSCIGHAVSDDGIHFDHYCEPVLRHGDDFGTGPADPQDPRVTKLGDTYYMVFCVWESIGKKFTRTFPAYATSKDLYNWELAGEMLPFDQFGYNKNVALFPDKIGGKYVVVHRPECPRTRHMPESQFNWTTWSRNEDDSYKSQTGVTLAFSDDLKTWSDSQLIMGIRENCWDCAKCGPAAPPIKTDSGWLLVYHGVDNNTIYRLGLALLDLDDPTKVLKRQTQPILSPKLEWEKRGDVPNVVFSSAALLDGTELSVYYGGADTVIGLARADVKDFLK